MVITGAGIITAFGAGWECNAQAFQQGQLAFTPVSRFDVSRQRVKSAAEIQYEVPLPQNRLSRTHQRRLDPAARYLMSAAGEALQQCRWEKRCETPLVFATTSGGMCLGEDFFKQASKTPVGRKKQISRLKHYQAQQQALDVAEGFGLSGPVWIVANACASGANAIGLAFELLRSGRFNQALTGGYDALSQLVFAGFDSLQALSPTQCRPFDQHRDGLSLGEGAAVLALETLEYAQSRGANILGEVCGYGAASDHHHLTQPHPQGSAALQAMSSACAIAGITPGEVDYINAHGTGTPLNDSAEAAAIHSWGGEKLRALVSSTKASVGHLLGAAGAVETVICLMALQGGWVPPTSTLKERDEKVGFEMPTVPRQMVATYALTNSFGFGGSNATLVLRRWP